MQLIQTIASIAVLLNGASAVSSSSNGVTYNGIVDPVTGHSRYLGIRYGQPPTGANRFKHPIAAVNPSPYSAAKFGPACYQAVGDIDVRALELDFPTDAEGGYIASSFSEDCLFLNVYVPSTATASSKLPVLVYVYGGSFKSGYGGIGSANGNAGLYNGNNIQAAGGNAIIVTLNYRLGVFGFSADAGLQTEGSLNSGLYDQQLAFQWVKANIASFGGDVTKITAIGQSAGAISVGVHLLSNKGTQSLFSRAVLLSGGPVLLYTTAAAASTVEAVAANSTCSGSANIACLRTLSAPALMKADMLANAAYLPVLDGTLVSQQTSSSISSGQFSKIPILVNTNQYEGSLFSVPPFSATVTLFDSIIDLGDYLYPTSLYPSASQGVNYTVAQYGDFFSDLMFRCPQQAISQAYTKAGIPVYASRFAYTPSIPIYTKFYPPSTPFPSSLTSWTGSAGTSGFTTYITDTTHATELPFVWNYGTYLTAAEKAISAKVINYIVTFANGGIPWSAAYGSAGNLFDMQSGAVISDSFLNTRCWAIEALATADATGVAAVAAVQADIAALVNAAEAAAAAAAKLASWF